MNDFFRLEIVVPANGQGRIIAITQIAKEGGTRGKFAPRQGQVEDATSSRTFRQHRERIVFLCLQMLQDGYYGQWQWIPKFVVVVTVGK